MSLVRLRQIDASLLNNVSILWNCRRSILSLIFHLVSIVDKRAIANLFEYRLTRTYSRRIFVLSGRKGFRSVAVRDFRASLGPAGKKRFLGAIHLNGNEAYITVARRFKNINSIGVMDIAVITLVELIEGSRVFRGGIKCTSVMRDKLNVKNDEIGLY